MKSGSLKDIINTYYMDTLTKTKQYCNQNIFFQSLITLHTKCISNCPSLEKSISLYNSYISKSVYGNATIVSKL